MFVLLLIGSVALVTGVPYAIASRDARSPGFEEARTTLTLPAGTSIDELQKATVYDIVDGDTIEVLIDGTLEIVRYYGVDTPERGTPCYRDATERNRRLIGGRVLLLPDARDRDSFSRLLRYIFLSDGTSVDATLVAEGMGEAWREDGRYRDELVSLEGGRRRRTAAASGRRDSRAADAGMRACGHAGMRACGHAGMRACGHAGMRACGHAGMRACGHAGIERISLGFVSGFSCSYQALA
jgi:endonuclease YncB( thermonuclease family)